MTKSFKYNRPTGHNQFLSDKNVLLANGKEHSRMRKMINPAFKMNNLKCMVNIFHEKAEVLTKVKLHTFL